MYNIATTFVCSQYSKIGRLPSLHQIGSLQSVTNPFILLEKPTDTPNFSVIVTNPFILLEKPTDTPNVSVI
jgi:hypothetical protein